VVAACEETTFKTGSHGVRVRLLVDAGGPVSMPVMDNIVFGERTTWKMYALCQTTGVRFDPPCESADLVGKSGTGRFVVDERDGLVGLAVARYLHSDPDPRRR